MTEVSKHGQLGRGHDMVSEFVGWWTSEVSRHADAATLRNAPELAAVAEGERRTVREECWRRFRRSQSATAFHRSWACALMMVAGILGGGIAASSLALRLVPVENDKLFVLVVGAGIIAGGLLGMAPAWYFLYRCDYPRLRTILREVLAERRLG